MSNDFNNAFDNMKRMVNSGNIPPEIQEMMKNISGKNISTNELNNMINNLSPDAMSNLSSMFNTTNTGSKEKSTNSNFNFDASTMLKMKNIIESMNDKNDPRANLLYSLKPYMRDQKKEKIDQYVNMLNMAKVAELMKNDKKGD